MEMRGPGEQGRERRGARAWCWWREAELGERGLCEVEEIHRFGDVNE